MKRQGSIGQKSCIDISKYKFIPPSKLLKAKAQPQLQKNLHFQSLIEPHHKEQQSDKFITISSKKGQHNQSNKENTGKVLAKSKQAQLYRSISNPKLTTSNSRNAILTQKNPPLENKKTEQQHLEKLTQFITELQAKDSQRNLQLVELRQENKLLTENLDKLNMTLALKNKQIMELNSKVKSIQSENREKSQEYILIIESLKKVIESQVAKISELTSKKTNKLEKTKHKASIYDHTTVQFYEEQESISNSNKDGIPNDISSRSSNRNIESLLYEQQPKKMRESMQHISKEDSAEENFFETMETCNLQPQNNVKQNHQTQFPTPNFGARTPKQSYVKSIQQENEGMSSLDCSLEQGYNNLSLSRISESVEQDFETSREHINIEKTEKHRTKANYSDPSTHQQLLDQIDQYLSKRTNIAYKR